jgi:hypothetical protein
MNKADLAEAFADAEFAFYESIAKLIVDNPDVLLADLREKHGITHYQMWTAQKMFHVHRKTGRGSLAYRKPVLPNPRPFPIPNPKGERKLTEKGNYSPHQHEPSNFLR